MKTILLAEDDPFIIDIYTNRLKKEGFMVDVAIDGQMALEKIKNNYPDLLILDILLPKMNGWEILKNVRDDVKMKNLKVIVVSNLNEKEYADNIHSLGVLKYFLKVQTTPEEIIKTIKEILK